MAHAVFIAHLPLLRIEPERVAIAGGILARYPFEPYNNLSGGAFEGQRHAYDATDPVVFVVEGEIDAPIFAPGLLEQRSTAEIKVAFDGWEGLLPQLGLGLIARFQDLLDFVRSAILLAAPAAALPSQRFSWAFLYAEDGHIRLSEEQSCSAIRVQGPADQEYLFFPEAAGLPLSAATLARAASLAPAVDRIWHDPDLSAALRALHFAASPTLPPPDQLTVAVMGLEALLLPEVRSGLKETFARRLARLLANDDASRRTVEYAARGLYDYRSAGLHGELLPSTVDAIANSQGQQFLAAAIERLHAASSNERSIEDLRRQLDAGSLKTGNGPALPEGVPEGLRPPQRLTAWHSHDFFSFSSGAALHVPEGYGCCWAPLIGLTAGVEFVDPGETSVSFVSITANDLVSLEPKDIRRDFLAQMRTWSATSACLGIWQKAVEIDLTAAFKRMIRVRDLSVVGLRLAGFPDFVDPELLGDYLNFGSKRSRRASILRQTILRGMHSKSGHAVTPADQETIIEQWRRLREYDDRAAHPEVDYVLNLFRRAHDRDFQPKQACAMLALSALEAMLGRFRPRKDRVQLEMLVAAICGNESEAAQWFTAKGRDFRKTVAHGTWSPASGIGPIGNLLAILRDTVPMFLDTWISLENRTAYRPGRIMIEAAESLVAS